jgi:hypothetical protein
MGKGRLGQQAWETLKKPSAKMARKVSSKRPTDGTCWPPFAEIPILTIRMRHERFMVACVETYKEAAAKNCLPRGDMGYFSLDNWADSEDEILITHVFEDEGEEMDEVNIEGEVMARVK